MRSLAAVLLAIVVVRRLFVVVAVRGRSMRPTYADGDLLLAIRVPALRRGRVIVFTPPIDQPDGPPYRVKRLVALPGDPTPDWVKDASGPVPPGRLVVRGDNSGHVDSGSDNSGRETSGGNASGSEDSGTYGYVERSRVLGVVVRKLHTYGVPTS